MKIRLTLTNGSTMDFDAPEDFNFIAWISSIRETGRWLIPQVYVPHESFLSAVVLTDDGKPVDIKGTLQ
jgi:hypothetical protein